MKFGSTVLQVSMKPLMGSVFDTTSNFQDGGHDVISRRNVLPSGECTHSVHRLPASNSGTRDIIGSLYALQFLMHSTFVLVPEQSIKLTNTHAYAQNPLHTFPHNFPVDGEAANLLRTC